MIQHTHSRKELENKNNKTKEKQQQTCETLEILQLKIKALNKEQNIHTYHHSYKHTLTNTTLPKCTRRSRIRNFRQRQYARVIYIVCAKDEVK